MGALTDFDGKKGEHDEQEGSVTKQDPAYEDEGEEKPSPEAAVSDDTGGDKGGQEQEKSEPKEKGERPGKSEWVPYTRLEETARKNQDLLRQNAAMAQAIKNLQTKFDKLNTELTAPVPPDPDEDPEGYRRHQLDLVKKDVQSVKQTLDADRDSKSKTDLQNKVFGKYQESAAQFSAEHPDFNEAYQHMMQRKAAAYRSAGFEEEELTRRIVDEEMGIVGRALGSGMNPAEIMYRMATAGFGWKGKGTGTTVKGPKSIATAGTTS